MPSNTTPQVLLGRTKRSDGLENWVIKKYTIFTKTK